MKKQPKITNKMQKVAVDILQELEIYMMGRKEVPEEIMQIYKKCMIDMSYVMIHLRACAVL